MARIIVADDDDIVGELVCDALTVAGHRAGYFTNGADALREIHRDAPDLLVLDCNMPGLSGVLLLRELKKSLDLYDLPVLVLSGRTSQQDIDLVYFAGANDYMKKPFEPAEVAFRVDELLARVKPSLSNVHQRPRIGFGRRNPLQRF